MSGVPYHAWTHMPEAAGGTDPIPGAAGGFAYIYHDSGITTDSGTWTSVGGVDTDTFVETFVAGDIFTVDGESGVISWDAGGYVLVVASTIFTDTSAAGDLIGVAVEHGQDLAFTTFFSVGSAVSDGTSNAVHGHHVTATAVLTRHNCCRMRVYQDTGAAKNWGLCRIDAWYITNLNLGTLSSDWT